jgi:phage tail-like protein
MADFQGTRHQPLKNHKFKVVIDGFVSAGFSKVSGLAAESDVSEYREGDDPVTPYKIKGQMKFDDVTLEQGVTPRMSDFFNWIREVRDVTKSGNAAEDGAPSENFRREVVVEVFDDDGEKILTHTLKNAWPRRIEFDDLDASSSDVWLGRIILVHEGLISEITSVGRAA